MLFIRRWAQMDTDECPPDGGQQSLCATLTAVHFFFRLLQVIHPVFVRLLKFRFLFLWSGFICSGILSAA